MLTLPKAILPVLNPFATLFRTPAWRKAQVLLAGATLAPGQRTVAPALRVMGLSGDRNYACYHHVLNRAAWPPLQAAHILLNLLIQHLGQGEFAPQALLCTSLAAAPAQILEWFVLRWQLEVTFHETRAHLGVETQRQWSDRAIVRTTPILMGLFSWVTLAVHLLQQQHPIIHRTAAWYAKPAPTFADAIALMRRHLWIASGGFSLSARDSDSEKPPASLYDRLVDTLAYAA